MQPIEFSAGDFICRCGDRGDALYYLLSGKVLCCIDVLPDEDDSSNKNDSSNKDDPATVNRRILCLFEGSDYFGEQAILMNEAKRTAHCIAQTPTKAYFLHRDDLVAVPGLLDHIQDESGRRRHAKSTQEEGGVALPSVKEEKKKPRGLALFKKGAKSVIQSHRKKKEKMMGGLIMNPHAQMSISQMVKRMVERRRESCFNTLWQKCHKYSRLVEVGSTMEPSVRHVPFCDMQKGYNILATTCRDAAKCSPEWRTPSQVALLYALVEHATEFWSHICPNDTTLYAKRDLVRRCELVTVQWKSSVGSNGLRPSCVYLSGVDHAKYFYILLSGRIDLVDGPRSPSRKNSSSSSSIDININHTDTCSSTQKHKQKSIEPQKKTTRTLVPGDMCGQYSLLSKGAHDSRRHRHVDTALLEENSPMPVELLRFHVEDYHEIIEKMEFAKAPIPESEMTIAQTMERRKSFALSDAEASSASWSSKSPRDSRDPLLGGNDWAKEHLQPRTMGILATKFYLLSSTAPFDALPWYERYRVACELDVSSYSRNSVVLHQGKRAGSIGIIGQGSVRLMLLKDKVQDMDIETTKIDLKSSKKKVQNVTTKTKTKTTNTTKMKMKTKKNKGTLFPFLEQVNLRREMELNPSICSLAVGGLLGSSASLSGSKKQSHYYHQHHQHQTITIEPFTTIADSADTKIYWFKSDEAKRYLRKSPLLQKALKRSFQRTQKFHAVTQQEVQQWVKQRKQAERKIGGDAEKKMKTEDDDENENENKNAEERDGVESSGGRNDEEKKCKEEESMNGVKGSNLLKNIRSPILIRTMRRQRSIGVLNRLRSERSDSTQVAVSPMSTTLSHRSMIGRRATKLQKSSLKSSRRRSGGGMVLPPVADAAGSKSGVHVDVRQQQEEEERKEVERRKEVDHCLRMLFS